jgi:protein-tyrosine phosphatase
MPNPNRSLQLTGATNFRDLGGYKGQGGRTVRWRQLFRSDHLAGLTPEDLAVVKQLGVARVLDFRGQTERLPQACALPGVVVHSLAIEPTVVQGLKTLLDAGQAVTVHNTVGLMQQTYRDFVLDNSPRFAEFFGHLLANDAPLVFHCTAGKDRTGFAAALLLEALGVPRSVILQDYLLTNTYYQIPSHNPAGLSPEVMNVLWRVQANFLEAAFEVVQADFGSVARYMKDALGVDAQVQARLAALYMQGAKP